MSLSIALYEALDDLVDGTAPSDEELDRLDGRLNTMPVGSILWRGAIRRAADVHRPDKLAGRSGTHLENRI
jgi:hypothetical protein